MKILFVCTGNTCRSPMAEALFNRLAADTGHSANSCGVMAGQGDGASPGAVRAVAEYGADLSKHRSKKISAELVEEADVILTMTDLHKTYVASAFPGAKDKVYSIGEYAGAGSGISDPYGGDDRLYKLCADQIYVLLTGIIERLKQKED